MQTPPLQELPQDLELVMAQLPQDLDLMIPLQLLLHHTIKNQALISVYVLMLLDSMETRPSLTNVLPSMILCAGGTLVQPSLELLMALLLPSNVLLTNAMPMLTVPEPLHFLMALSKTKAIDFNAINHSLPNQVFALLRYQSSQLLEITCVLTRLNSATIQGLSTTVAPPLWLTQEMSVLKVKTKWFANSTLDHKLESLMRRPVLTKSPSAPTTPPLALARASTPTRLVKPTKDVNGIMKQLSQVTPQESVLTSSKTTLTDHKFSNALLLQVEMSA
jgi:hypothetical protein